MSNEAVTWASEADRKRDLRRQKIGNIKSSIKMAWHTFYWRTLHLTRLARPYSKIMCHFGLYRKFADGRCMWCGGIHR